jgi:hypothetical protein
MSGTLARPREHFGRRRSEIAFDAHPYMKFQLARHYTREEIHEALGGSTEEYLPTKDGQVVCGAFRPDANPDAPMIILPGFGRKIESAAEQFVRQETFIPVFLKRETNRWQYVGDFRVKRVSKDPDDIAKQERRAGRQGTVSMILFLERPSELQ